jgi:hypothetical protein
MDNRHAEIDRDFIVKNSKKPFYICGVYFLIKNDEIVYVGQSVNIYIRIREHKSFDFDKVFILPYDVEFLNDAEKYFIDKFSPVLNKRPGVGKADYSSGICYLNNFAVPKNEWKAFKQAAANLGKYEGDLLNMVISQYVQQVSGAYGEPEPKEGGA